MSLRNLPVSLDQERALQVHELASRRRLRVLRSVDIAFDVRGRVEPDLLEASLQHLVAGHPAFRVSFTPSASLSERDRRAALDRLMMASILTPSLYVQNIATEARIVLGRGGQSEHAADRSRDVVDVSRPPLMRASLTACSSSRQIVELSISRLICDPVSVGIIARDLQANYAALEKGISPTVSRQDASYAARASREQSMLGSGEWESFRRYWEEQWSTYRLDQIEASDLPLAQPTSTLELLTSPRETEWLTMSPSEAAEIESFCNDGWASLVVLVAACGRVIGRFTARTTFPLWVLWPNRTSAAERETVGSFATSHPVAIDLSRDAGDDQYLNKVARAVRETRLRHEYPLEALWMHLKMRHDRSLRIECCVYDERGRDPAVDCSVAFMPYGKPRVSLSDAPVQVSLHVFNTECLIAVSYSTPLFTPAAARELVGWCKKSLLAIVHAKQTHEPAYDTSNF